MLLELPSFAIVVVFLCSVYSECSLFQIDCIITHVKMQKLKGHRYRLGAAQKQIIREKLKKLERGAIYYNDDIDWDDDDEDEEEEEDEEESEEEDEEEDDVKAKKKRKKGLLILQLEKSSPRMIV